MAKRVRTDCHRPAEFVPADYSYSLSYSGGTTFEGEIMPPVLVTEAIERYREHGAKIHEGVFSCDVCGARFIYGDLWLHEPSGELISLGWECAEKYECAGERGEYERTKAIVWERAHRAARLERTAGKRAELFAAHPGLEAALETPHYITSDIKSRFERYGSLSEAQVALVFKLAREEAAAEAEKALEAEKAEKLVAIPEEFLTGRHEFTGTIAVAYYKETAYGHSLKLIVEVPEGEGGEFFKVWGTCPAAIHESKPTAYGYSTGWSPGELKGAEVAFSAAVERSEETESFGFFKRPTKARVVTPSPEMAESLAETEAELALVELAKGEPAA